MIMFPCSPKPQGGLQNFSKALMHWFWFSFFFIQKGSTVFLFLPGIHRHTEKPVVPDHTASSQNEVHARNDLLNTCEIPNKHLNWLFLLCKNFYPKYSRTLWLGHVLKMRYLSDLRKFIKIHGFNQKRKFLQQISQIHTKIFFFFF